MSAAVVAFYSYKGGVGRSLAVSNLAWALSQRGRRVLVVDLDLEAPGLDRVPAISPRGGALPPGGGIMELVADYARAGELPDVTAHAYAVETRDANGRLWIMPAGRRDAAYQAHLATLDWSNLDPEGGSVRFAEAFRAAVQEAWLPHYVLVDARTGFSDIGGFSTHVLADQVVLVFNLTRPCLEGTIQAYRSMAALPQPPHFILVASPMPPVASEAGTVIERRLNAARAHMERGLIYQQPIVTIDYDPRMVLTADLAVSEPDRYPAAARYERLRDLIQRANLDEVYGDAERAAAYQRDGRTQDAIDVLRAFVEAHPQNADGWTSLGALYRSLGRREDARRAYRQSLQIAPRLSEGHRGLGEVELDAGAGAQAIDHLKQAESCGDRSAGLYRAMCAAHESEGDLAGLRLAGGKLVGALISELTDGEEPPNRDGAVSDLRDDFITHMRRFQPYARFDPERFWVALMGSFSVDHRSKQLLLIAASNGGLKGDQLRDLNRIFDQERAKLLHVLGPDVIELMEQVATSGVHVADQDALLAICPTPRLTAVALTWRASRQPSQTDQALVTKAIAIDETYAAARRLLADALATGSPPAEDLESAVKHLQVATEHEPERSETWSALGLTLGRWASACDDPSDGRLEASRSALARALELDPDNVVVLQNAGLTLGRLADLVAGAERRTLLEQSAEHSTRAITLEPDNPPAQQNLGKALEELAQMTRGEERQSFLQRARVAHTRAIELNPKITVLGGLTSCLIALAHEAQGDERAQLLLEAEQACEHGNALEPESANYNLACVMSMQGRWDEAWTRLTGYLTTRPHMVVHALADRDLAALWRARPEWRAELEARASSNEASANPFGDVADG